MNYKKKKNAKMTLTLKKLLTWKMYLDERKKFNFKIIIIIDYQL